MRRLKKRHLLNAKFMYFAVLFPIFVGLVFTPLFLGLLSIFPEPLRQFILILLSPYIMLFEVNLFFPFILYGVSLGLLSYGLKWLFG